MISLNDGESRQEYELKDPLKVIDQQIFVHKIKVEGQLIMVADLQKSLTIYTLELIG